MNRVNPLIRPRSRSLRANQFRRPRPPSLRANQFRRPMPPSLAELDYKLYPAPSQNANALYTQQITGKKILTVANGRIDQTIPKKTSNINDKAKPDGVLNEALPLFAGASVGTAFCFTALALGGVVPVLTVGALLVLGGLGLYQAHEQKNDKAPSERVVIKNLSRIKDENKLFLL